MLDEQFTFESQLRRLKEAAGVDTDSALTTILGVRASGIYNAKTVRGKIPNKWLVLISTKYGVNLEWLVSGTGPRDAAQSAQVGSCQQCLEFQRQLAVANERLYEAMRENGDLKESVGKLRAELAESKNKLASAPEGGSMQKTA